MTGIATALARSWTRLYTAGLPRDLRGARREEIESDLWEQGVNGDEPSLFAGLHILLRLLLGLPSDIVWRAETGVALRSGKDPNVKDKTWTLHRLVSLIVALVVMPVPPSWIKSASASGPGTREESTLSATVLGIGAHLCLMPVLLGGMSIFWEGLADWPGALAWGAVEVAAGFAALAGLYIARSSPAAGVLLIMLATATMIPLAFWALPAIIVIGIVLVAMAIVRWFAPAPAPALAT